MKYLYMFLITTAIFVLIDIFWIGLIANKFYTNQLGELLRSPFKLAPAAIFYTIYIIAIIYFVITPNLATNDLVKVIVSSALLGLTCYATYDLTNYSTLANFPLTVVIVDLIWGTFLTTSVGTISFLIIRKLIEN